jgi:hypothetical protein
MSVLLMKDMQFSGCKSWFCHIAGLDGDLKKAMKDGKPVIIEVYETSKSAFTFGLHTQG